MALPALMSMPGLFRHWRLVDPLGWLALPVLLILSILPFPLALWELAKFRRRPRNKQKTKRVAPAVKLVNFVLIVLIVCALVFLLWQVQALIH